MLRPPLWRSFLPTVTGLQVQVGICGVHYLRSPHCFIDTSGKVRVWSWDNPEHMTKLETPVFSGEVKDLDWDSESKKIVAVGDGSPMVGTDTQEVFYMYRWRKYLHGTPATAWERWWDTISAYFL